MATQVQSRIGPGAQALIERPACFIDGEWVTGDGGDPVASIDPFTEQVLGAFAPASVEQVSAAVAAARRAFDDGRWSGLPGAERRRLLHRVNDGLAAQRDELIELAVAELGTPISTARAFQVDATLEHLAWFADAAERGPLGGYEQGMPVHAGPPVASASLLVRDPVGVVAALTPYNIPLLTTAWKVGGALAAGCTCVLVPSPRAQLISLAFARAVAQAGLPDGVFNFVVGETEVGQALTESHDVDMVTFTGSNAVGAHVMRQASGNFKRLVLELGGKSPNLLLPGADVEASVAPSVLRFTRNSGQACGATTRTFVPRADYERYVDGARSFLATMGVGSPWDEETVVGPLIRGEHRDRVEGYVERALADGARVEAGGGRPERLEHGFFMNPVLVGAVSNEAEISREELFGPVGVVIPYDSVDDAVAMANASRYGLNANVWGPPAEALAVARRIRSGTVTINGGGALRADVPFGGFRESGIGREAGELGFLEFFETKHLQWPLV